jgi:hypothetical protein
MMTWLIFSIIITAVYLIVVYFELDRSFRIASTPLSDMVETYVKTVKTPERVVCVIDCESEDPNGSECLRTVKSVLDSSVRVDDIAIQTDKPWAVNEDLKKVCSAHFRGTEPLREADANTIILYLKPGREYGFEEIENMVENMVKKMKQKKDLEERLQVKALKTRLYRL